MFGRFHILSDFDEGKRSCRRKLERHNNRRRRKPADSGVADDKEPQGVTQIEDGPCDDEVGKGIINLNGATGFYICDAFIRFCSGGAESCTSFQDKMLSGHIYLSMV